MDILEGILQFGALGLLAAVLLWIFRGFVPKLFGELASARDAFRAELKAERESREVEREADREAFKNEIIASRQRNNDAWESFRTELSAERDVHKEQANAVRELVAEVKGLAT